MKTVSADRLGRLRYVLQKWADSARCDVLGWNALASRREAERYAEAYQELLLWCEIYIKAVKGDEDVEEKFV
jgi:hypothetical protein